MPVAPAIFESFTLLSLGRMTTTRRELWVALPRSRERQ
jgi:hypothetical protein